MYNCKASSVFSFFGGLCATCVPEFLFIESGYQLLHQLRHSLGILFALHILRDLAPAFGCRHGSLFLISIGIPSRACLRKFLGDGFYHGGRDLLEIGLPRSAILPFHHP